MSLIEWPKPFVEYAGFLAAYAMIGAIGGALGVCYLLLAALNGKKSHAVALVPMASAAIAGLAFVIAARRINWAWVVAALATTVFAVRSMHLDKWTSTVNPLHVIGGALWLGTLFVIVAAGVPAALYANVAEEQRGPAVAWLVRAFSPVALIGAALLALTGVITAVRHVKYLAAMWTTPYGYALDVKLVAVLAVVAFGYWNWRRLKPRWGDETAARELHVNARYEIAMAALVLVITGILVSIPSPKLP